MQYLIKIILVSIAFTSCTVTKLKTPEDIGKKAFKVISTFGAGSEKDYFGHIVKIEDLKKITDNKEIFADNGVVELIHSLSQEKFIRTLKIDKYYSKILEAGKKEAISWPNIKYSKFEHIIKNNDGINNMCKGKLHFIHNEKKYSIKVEAINMGNHYEFWVFKKLALASN